MIRIAISKSKRWLIYRVCCLIIGFAFLLLLGFFVLAIIYPDQLSLRIALPVVCMGISAMLLVMVAVIRYLDLTRHVELHRYALPYKLKKDKTLTIVLVCGVVAWGIISARHFISGFSAVQTLGVHALQVELIRSWIIWALIILLYVFVYWRGMILHDAHIVYYELWKKSCIRYNEIIAVEIMSKNNARNGRSGYGCCMRLITENVSLEDVNLTPYTAPAIRFMLHVIHQNAPHATMNEFAKQLRQGEFPILLNPNINSFIARTNKE